MADDSNSSASRVSRSRWIWGGVVVFSAAALVGLGVMGIEGILRVIPVAGISRTTSMEPVNITLKAEGHESRKTPWPKLKIPQAYISDAANRRGGSQERVRIETGLPDLLPRPALSSVTAPVGTPEWVAQQAFSANGMVVNLEPAHKEHRDFSGVWASFTGASGERGGYVPREPLHGLRRVHLVPCMRPDVVERKNCDADRPSGEHFFALNERGEVVVWFSCMPPWTGEGGGCETRLVHHGIQVLLIFRRGELGRWTEFVSGSKSLVDKFLVKGG